MIRVEVETCVSEAILVCDVFSINVRSIYHACVCIVGATLSCKICCVGDWYEIKLSI